MKCEIGRIIRGANDPAVLGMRRFESQRLKRWATQTPGCGPKGLFLSRG
jgi:hypothetical protein